MALQPAHMNVLVLLGFAMLQLTAALPELSLTVLSRPSFPDSLRRRQSPSLSLDVSPSKDDSFVFVNVTVGTPPQLQSVLLDTGSSDLYFEAANTCGSPGATPETCRVAGFDRSLSSTYREILNASSGFAISYADNSTARGPFGEDVIGIGSTSINDAQFGVAEIVNDPPTQNNGILGIGYSSDEVLNKTDLSETTLLNGTILDGNYTSGPSTPYPNILDKMVQAKLIDSRLYSIFLNGVSSIDKTSGTILFGGIDKSKYKGNLTTLNLLPSNVSLGIVTTFAVTITEVIVQRSDNRSIIWSEELDDVAAYNSNHSVATLLDTGTTAWNLKQQDFDAIVAAFGARTDTPPLLPYLPCRELSSEDALHLTFGGRVTIIVPADYFVTPLGSGYCELGIQVVNNSPVPILGWQLLRSIYTVYDLDNGQVSLAQAGVNVSAQPEIVEVQAGPNGIANAGIDVVTTNPNTWSIAPMATPTNMNSSTGSPAPTGQTSSFYTSTRYTRSGASPTPSTGSSNTTRTTSSTTPDAATSSSSSRPSISASCPQDGALVCNGSDEFGICNIGSVVWQKVAPGTGCFNGGIIGTGIYALPVATPL